MNNEEIGTHFRRGVIMSQWMKDPIMSALFSEDEKNDFMERGSKSAEETINIIDEMQDKKKALEEAGCSRVVPQKEPAIVHFGAGYYYYLKNKIIEEVSEIEQMKKQLETTKNQFAIYENDLAEFR